MTKTKPATAQHKEPVIFWVIIAVAVVVSLAVMFIPKLAFAPGISASAKFAECLSTKGVAMYGVDTCPNCQLQKKMFAEDFDRIHYVNCDFKQDECTQNGIEGYPTWVYNGKRFRGIQTFPTLAQISGCQAPTP